MGSPRRWGFGDPESGTHTHTQGHSDIGKHTTWTNSTHPVPTTVPWGPQGAPNSNAIYWVLSFSLSMPSQRPLGPTAQCACLLGLPLKTYNSTGPKLNPLSVLPTPYAICSSSCVSYLSNSTATHPVAQARNLQPSSTPSFPSLYIQALSPERSHVT